MEFVFLGFFLQNPICTTVMVLLAVYLGFEYRSRRRLPPGPRGLPLIGCALTMDMTSLSQQALQYGEHYRSDIIYITNTGLQFVFLNTYDLIKEVFQKRLDATGRNDNFSFFKAAQPKYTGIINASGHVWKQARRFSVSMLKDLGMGRFGAETKVLEESVILRQQFENYNGKPFDPQQDLNVAVSNIICQLVFGKRFNTSHKAFMVSLEGTKALMNKFVDQNTLVACRYEFARKTWLRHHFQTCVEHYKKFINFVESEIDEHKENYNGQTSDLIYCYMKEMEEVQDEVFDDQMLVSLIVDYFLAGSETTYNTLNWSILSMAVYQNVQKKVQEELDKEIGDRTPGMRDKKLTPYTDATICEVQRHYTLLPVGLAHTNLHNDIELEGYIIPKGSLICGNIDAVHHDPKYWKYPDEFNPENFLENGQVANTERLIPFGLGRRACAGEALARMELYVFFTSILKNFDIRLETDDTIADMTGHVALTVSPKPYKIRMYPRVDVRS